MAHPCSVDLSSSLKKGKDISVHEDEATDFNKKQKKTSISTPSSSAPSVNTNRFEDEAMDPNIEIMPAEIRPLGRKATLLQKAKLLHRWPTVLRKRE